VKSYTKTLLTCNVAINPEYVRNLNVSNNYFVNHNQVDGSGGRLLLSKTTWGAGSRKAVVVPQYSLSVADSIPSVYEENEVNGACCFQKEGFLGFSGFERASWQAIIA
jgi:hypothetical protein